MQELERKLKNHKLLLGSKSPRRRNLLREAGFKFEILPAIETDETFPADMPHTEVPVYLAEEKAKVYAHYITSNEIIITADTIVSLNNEILGKPVDIDDAKALLQKISGNCHEVVSGVCISSLSNKKKFNAITKVYFKDLTTSEIDYYLKHYKPLDKAGAYGIQEWIGYIGVKAIEGSFYNVMGLPIQKLYSELINFF